MNWTKEKPTQPGAYRVRGYALSKPKRVALVEVKRIGGHLCTNLHACNSEWDITWHRIESLNDGFKWCGPLMEPKS